MDHDYENTVLECVLWLLIGNPQRRSPVNNHKEKRQITLLFSILFTATKKNKQKEAYPAVRRTD
ncbi:hypothetical protein VEE45_23660 [Escherichia coli]|nr:hypothetical protein VEE45_23660 [Escherichia coli]